MVTVTNSYRVGERYRAIPGANLDCLSLLIIDDVEEVAKMMREGLTSLGQNAVYALAGEEALAILDELAFDAVISDLDMPDMNGWEIARSIKLNSQRRGVGKTPFILLTGWHQDEGLWDRAAEEGVDAVVEKPVDLGELLAVVRKAVRARRPLSKELVGPRTACSAADPDDHDGDRDREDPLR